jgi:hypothetical protein
MDMGRTELHEIMKEAFYLEGNTPLTDGIGRSVPHLLKRERGVIREMAAAILYIEGNGPMTNEELESELHLQGLGVESKGEAQGEKEKEAGDKTTAGSTTATPMHRGNRTPSRKGLTYDQVEVSTMINAINAYKRDRLALEDIAAEAWKRIHLQLGEDYDKNGRLTRVVFTTARKLQGDLSAKEADMGICLRQNEWGKRVLGTYALVDWYDCLNSPAPRVSVKHVGDPDMMRGFRAGEKIGTEVLKRMELADRQIWEDIELGIKLNEQTRTGTSQDRMGDHEMEHPALAYRAGVTATLAGFRGNEAVLEAIALETITEGKPRKWIERLA